MKKMKKIYILMLILLLIFIITIIINMPKAKEYEYKDYTIKAGDTLYDIAKKYRVCGDIREDIFNIEKDNGIKNCGNIQAGQVIKVRVLKWN